MNYSLHQLRILVEVARYKSVTKAAESMHMTQPALSIQLKNLQNQFEHPLTEVIGRQLYLTDFGNKMVEMAENVLREAEAIRFLTKEYGQSYTGRLAVTSASTGKYVIPYFLTDFMDLNPGVDLILDVTNKDRVVNSLKQNSVDLALVSVVPDGLDLEQLEILPNHLFLVGDSAEYDDSRRFIFREPGSATRVAMDNYLNFQGRKKIELMSSETVKQAVVAGLGYSVLPLIGLRHELTSGDLHIIKRPDLPIVTQWTLVWHKNKKLSPVAQAYLAYVREHRKEIVNRYFSWYVNFLELANSH